MAAWPTRIRARPTPISRPGYLSAAPRAGWDGMRFTPPPVLTGSAPQRPWRGGRSSAVGAGWVFHRVQSATRLKGSRRTEDESIRRVGRRSGWNRPGAGRPERGRRPRQPQSKSRRRRTHQRPHGMTDRDFLVAVEEQPRGYHYGLIQHVVFIDRRAAHEVH